VGPRERRGTQFGGDGLTGGDRLVTDGRVLVQQAAEAGQDLGSRGTAAAALGYERSRSVTSRRRRVRVGMP